MSYRPTTPGRHPEERSDEGSPSCPVLDRRELLECGDSASAFRICLRHPRLPARTAAAPRRFRALKLSLVSSVVSSLPFRHYNSLPLTIIIRLRTNSQLQLQRLLPVLLNLHTLTFRFSRLQKFRIIGIVG